MMTVVRCRSCDKDSTPVGQPTASIDVVLSKYCDGCGFSHKSTVNYHFCSVECLCDYVKSHTDQIKASAAKL